MGWQKDDFLFGKPLGKGVSGTVYLATHKESGKRYAIKVMRKSHIKRSPFSWRDEIDGNQRVSGHENIVSMHGWFEHGKLLYFIFDLVQGKELFEIDYFDEKEAAWVVRCIAVALLHCHERGVYHCDVKPENIISVEGDEDTSTITSRRYKLLDFGHCVLREKLNLAKGYRGSVHTIPPEAMRDNIFHSSFDCWQLGILAYELLYGEPPFFGDTKTDTKKAIIKGELVFPSYDDVSETACEFIRRLLDREPDGRMTLEDALAHPWLDIH